MGDEIEGLVYVYWFFVKTKEKRKGEKCLFVCGLLLRLCPMADGSRPLL